MPHVPFHSFYTAPIWNSPIENTGDSPPSTADANQNPLLQSADASEQFIEITENSDAADIVKATKTPKEPRSEEEKEEIIRTLIRARRMYSTYRREECQEGCLSFPEYAACFFFINEDDAVQFISTGDIKA